MLCPRFVEKDHGLFVYFQITSFQQRRHLVGGYGLAKIITLDGVAPMCAQKLKLFLGLNAFRDNVLIKAMSHGNDGFRNNYIIGVIGQVLHE